MDHINIAHEHQYPVIHCPECGRNWVIIAAFSYLEDDGMECRQIIAQDRADYCPDCGKRMEAGTSSNKQVQDSSTLTHS